MKTFLLSNTHFGYKNNDEKWLNLMLDFFYDFYIPFLEKYATPKDKLIHLGNLFNNSQSININTLNHVQELFKTISNILPVYLVVGYNDKSTTVKSNHINSLNIFKGFENIHIIHKEPTLVDDVVCVPWSSGFKHLENIFERIILINIDYKKYSTQVKEILNDAIVYSGFYNDRETDGGIKVIGSPYQLTANNSSDVGFYVLDGDRELWTPNTFSPKFTKIEIKSEEDIDNLDKDFIDNNFVDVVVDSEAIDSNKTKIKFLLSQYKLNSIKYKEQEIIYDIEDENKSLDDLIDDELDGANEDVKNEYKNIIKIYNEKF